MSCRVLSRAQAKPALQPLPDLDDSLIQGGYKPRKSRLQRPVEKHLGSPLSEFSTEGLDVKDWKIPDNIVQLQKEDETLKPFVC